MKLKYSEELHEKISQILKDEAKTGIKNIFNRKIAFRNRIFNGFTGLLIYTFFGSTWLIRYVRYGVYLLKTKPLQIYSTFKQYLRIKFGVRIELVIFILIISWLFVHVI